MEITKEGRHEYSKRRRKLVRKGLNPYDDKMLINLDKEWVQLRIRISEIKYTSYGTLIIMHDLEEYYYSSLGLNTELDKIIYEVGVLRGIITEPTLIAELDAITNYLITHKADAESYLNLKRLIVKLQAKIEMPIHFYEALDDEYKEVYEEVMSDTFKLKK